MPITVKGTEVEELTLDASNVGEAYFKGVQVYVELGPPTITRLIRSSGQILVDFNAASGNPDGYEFQADTSSSFPTAGWRSMTVTSQGFGIAGPNLGNQLWYVRIRATKGAARSAPSNVLSIRLG